MSQINVNTINSAGDPSISISVPFRYSSSVATGGRIVPRFEELENVKLGEAKFVKEI